MWKAESWMCWPPDLRAVWPLLEYQGSVRGAREERRDGWWDTCRQRKPTPAKPNLIEPHLYFLACGQVVKATRKKCSHTDWTGGLIVCNQRQAKSAFHVYTGHTSLEAACYSITLFLHQFEETVQKYVTAVCHMIIIIINIIIMLQMKKVYIERNSSAARSLICLFSPFLYFASEVSGIPFVSVLLLLNFSSIPISQWTEPVLGVLELILEKQLKEKLSIRAHSAACLVSRLLDLRCQIQSAISVLYLPFPTSFLFFLLLYSATSVLLHQDLNFLRRYIYRCIYIYAYIQYIIAVL